MNTAPITDRFLLWPEGTRKERKVRLGVNNIGSSEYEDPQSTSTGPFKKALDHSVGRVKVCERSSEGDALIG
jgi:hypothetical protein